MALLCVNLIQGNFVNEAIFGSKSSPIPSALPLTQIFLFAKYFQVFIPLAHTILEDFKFASLGKADFLDTNMQKFLRSFIFLKLLVNETLLNHWYSFNSPSWENTFAFPDGEDDPDLIEARRTLSKEVYHQEFGAEFTSLSGRVFDDFTRDGNVCNYNYQPLLPVYLSLDFGYRCPAVGFFQVVQDRKGIEHIYMFDEMNFKISDGKVING